VNILAIGAMHLASDIVCLVCESRIIQPPSLTVGGGHYATSRKVAGSRTDEVNF
jgi:hypothetical protein